jgi:hypothetical protein
MARESSNADSRRGCFILAAAIAIILLALAAIGEGWIGQVERGKITDVPAVAGNQG